MFVYLVAAYGVFLASLGSASGEPELVACGAAMVAIGIVHVAASAVVRRRARRHLRSWAES